MKRKVERETRHEPQEFSGLEAELHAARKPNRHDRRTDERRERYLSGGQQAEAAGFARVIGQHRRSRPTNSGAA